MRSLRRRRPTTATLILAGLVVVVSACSGETPTSAPARSFCEQAQAFEVFQRDAAVDLADAERAPAFLAVSIEQLEVLATTAPPEAEADIAAVIEGFVDLDTAMAEADYDLSTLLFDGYADVAANDASERLDGVLAVECGLSAAGADAPRPFTPVELRAIVGGSDDDPTRLLVSQLVDVVGLTVPEAHCLVDALGDDAVPLLLGGEPTGDDTAETFASSLVDCDINPEDLP